MTLLKTTERKATLLRLISVAVIVSLFVSTTAFAIEDSVGGEETTTAATTQQSTTAAPEQNGADTKSTTVPQQVTAESTTNKRYALYTTTTTTEPTTADMQLQSLQDEYNKLEKELAQNQDKLSEVKSDMSDKKSVVSSIYKNISATQSQIDVLTTRINLLNSDINEASSNIEQLASDISTIDNAISTTQLLVTEKNAEKDKTYDLLKERLRAMYMSGSSSELEFLLSSDSFSTLLTRTELLRSVAEHDNGLMLTLSQDIATLNELEQTLGEQKATSEQKKTELTDTVNRLEIRKSDSQESSSALEEKRSSIQQQYNQANNELKKLDATSAEYKAIISQQEDEMERLSKKMEEYIKGAGSTTGDTSGVDDSASPYLGNSSVSSSGMIWPVIKCSTYISSPYGNRVHPITGEYKMHSGIDITGGGINGKPVVAARNGTVIFAGWQGGYGNYVIVDHGNGITTCYAHCSTLLVSKGEKVMQGQQIANVGSTGNSTGPHLHFEVRINGATTQPLNYVNVPG